MEIRAATSSIFDDQTQNILSQSANLQKYANELSSGVSLNLPSDDPIAVSQVLQLGADITNQDTLAKNAQIASNQLTSVDGALSNLTDLLQSANTLAVQGASSVLNDGDRKAIAAQVGQLFDEAVSVANTQYDGSFVFAGTASTPAGPVTTVGSPAGGVRVFGNNQIVTEQFGTHQSLPLSTSLQAAFNVGAPDGSKDVFATLLALRDALNGSSGVSMSSRGAVAATGAVVGPTTTLGTAGFAKALTPDSNGDYAVTLAGASGKRTLTFTAASTLTDVVAAINASGTGVTAAFDARASRVTLSSASPFELADAPSAGATSSGNLVEALALPAEASVATQVSGQIGDVQNALNAALSARSSIGATIQTLAEVQSSTQLKSTNETASKSALTDTNVADVATKLTLAQTALQAAYMATSKIEGHMLFDYI